MSTTRKLRRHKCTNISNRCANLSLVSVSYQVSLFDAVSDSPSFTPMSEAVRTPLAHGAWVDHLPNWLTGADSLFDTLISDVPWRAERRVMYDRMVDVPRLVNWYGQGETLPHPLLAEGRDRVSAHYLPSLGEPLVSAGLCYYRNGNDSVAWHGDTIGRGKYEDTVVAILSLGSTRTLSLRPRGGGASIRFPMAHGDLVVMGGSAQRTWEHAILKSARQCGPRISVQFRPVGVA